MKLIPTASVAPGYSCFPPFIRNQWDGGLTHDTMRDSIGELEELVLLITALLDGDAYGVGVQTALREQAGRPLRISAVHSVLRRLEEKGYLTSRMGGATPERGGRRKRLFTITAAGRAVLAERRRLRNRLWDHSPGLGLAGGAA